MIFPRLYLALDNCFASKRWTEPLEWLEIARDAGVYCVEASADTECDPLYSPPDVLQDWLAVVRSASAKTGVRVVNFYSGHGTYATLGLAHPDVRVRDHIQHRWLDEMIRSASALGASLGFFCHAFPQHVLKQPERYAKAEQDLYCRLAELARFAAESGLTALSVEQMYTPHQIPWTIDGGQRLLEEVYQQGGVPIYLTLDTGHQVGQQHYLRPTEAQMAAAVAGADVWVGYLNVSDQTSIEDVSAYVGRMPYLFAQSEDGDLYAWLRLLGCYSPIIHLQQTDGTASAHRPFTTRYNQTGIVKPEQLFAALMESYQQPERVGAVPRCADIYLTLEIFSSTLERPGDILANIRASAAYWRQYLPEDGITLDEAVRRYA